ncbi:MAG: hypothetical protein ORO03_05575, partial [Alphaproteobacteria bacterium]|nr:hypothetical protein [Alphaproteobacteria bacterium]
IGSRDAALQGIGVRYGGGVKIQGISTGAAKDLRWIEGTGVGVTAASGLTATTGASTFSGDLTLVSTGAGFNTGGGLAAILVAVNLTTAGDLTLIETASATATFGIQINSATLTAGGNLTVINNGTNGIILQASANTGVNLAAGSNNWVKLQTVVTGVTLSTANSFSVTSGSLRLDLGKLGALTSSGAGSPYTLNAIGRDVYFTGSTSGNSAKIAVGSGSFTFVNDRRSVTADTTLDSTTTPTTATIGWGSGISWTAGTPVLAINTYNSSAGVGLTVTTTGSASTINNQGVVYGGKVIVNGVTSASDAGSLRYIEGTKIEVKTTTSAFNGGLTLVSNSESLDLGVGVSTSGGQSYFAPSMGLTSDVTIAATAKILINLGGGAYNNGSGAGFTLNTTGQNLSITAASISNTTASKPIFSLGTGTLTVNTIAKAGVTVTDSVSYDGGFITSQAEETKFNGATQFYVTNAADVTTARNTFNADSSIFVVGASALTANNLGTRTLNGTSIVFSAGTAGTGLYNKGGGNYFWATGGSTLTLTNANAVPTPITIPVNKTVVFYNLTNPVMPTTVPEWLERSSSLTFEGANSFNAGLTIGSAGAISQAAGSTLTVSTSPLSVTNSSAITLSNTGNTINYLGAVKSSGSI